MSVDLVVSVKDVLTSQSQTIKEDDSHVPATVLEQFSEDEQSDVESDSDTSYDRDKEICETEVITDIDFDLSTT